ncbi:peptidase inhibitor family I36 protein [Streptomyces fumanus]|uniref:Peptidase inhibitor family I36 n=1 Tax=Streptomyces fumanus TaxID=67302 RepID=A0A919DUQ6_9ACTN|nr:peptidase inhibitor family I36 protein [Streptomyces fumanus]GHE86262.1 hypothetical protein GCM10018772_07340 [Streptomyces fumanus]
MKLTTKTAVVAAAIASTAVLAVPGTASADPKDGIVSACQEGKICLFDGHNYTGDMLQLDPLTSPPVSFPFVGWDWNDRASSVWNRSRWDACIYTDADFNGRYYLIPPGATQELLFLYDNAVSSVAVAQCGG